MSYEDKYKNFSEEEKNGGIKSLQNKIFELEKNAKKEKEELEKKLLKEKFDLEQKIKALKEYQKSDFTTNTARKEKIEDLYKEIDNLTAENRGNEISIEKKIENSELIKEKYVEIDKLEKSVSLKKDISDSKKLLKDLSEKYYNAPVEKHDNIKEAMINKLVKNGCNAKQAETIANNVVMNIPINEKVQPKTKAENKDYENTVDINNANSLESGDNKKNDFGYIPPNGIMNKIKYKLKNFILKTEGEEENKAVAINNADDKLKAVVKKNQGMMNKNLMVAIGAIAAAVALVVVNPGLAVGAAGAIAGAGAVELEKKVMGK